MKALDRLRALLLRAARVPAEPSDPIGGEGTLVTFRASASYYRYLLIGWVLKQAGTVAGAAWGFVMFDRFVLSHATGLAHDVLSVLEFAGIMLIPLQALVSLLAVRLDWEMRWYKVTDRSLRIREGIWHVRELTMTFANVQNMEVHQGPLQRLFGISDLRVRSAGGGSGQGREGKRGHDESLSGHDAWFRGVDNAAQVRDLILTRLKRLKDAGLGDHEDRGVAEAGGERHAAEAPAGHERMELLRELVAEARELRRAAELAAPG